MDSLYMGIDSRLRTRLLMLGKDPRNKMLRANCVDLALVLQNYDIALQVADEALENEPHDPQAKFERASALMGMKRFTEALDDLNALAKEVAPTPPAIQQNIGLCHYLLGDFSAARATFDELYLGGNRSSDVVRLLISTLHHLGEVSAAINIADRADDYAKTDPALAGVMALLYLDANQPDKAAHWSSRSLVRNPNSLDSMVVQGTLKAGTFDLPSARELFERALSIAPTTGRAWIGLSLVSMADHDLSNAREQAQQAVKYMPSHIGSWHVLGWIQLIQGDLQNAHTTFEHALSLNRNFAESHGALAAIAAIQGDRGGAERYIEVAERLDSNCLSAKFARSTLQKGKGDDHAARDTLIGALSGISRDNVGMISRIVGELTRIK